MSQQTDGEPADGERHFERLSPNELEHVDMCAEVDVTGLSTPEKLHVQEAAEQHERHFIRSIGDESLSGTANRHNYDALDLAREDVDRIEMHVTAHVGDADSEEVARLWSEANLRGEALMNLAARKRAVARERPDE